MAHTRSETYLSLLVGVMLHASAGIAEPWSSASGSCCHCVRRRLGADLAALVNRKLDRVALARRHLRVRFLERYGGCAVPAAGADLRLRPILLKMKPGTGATAVTSGL